MKTKRTSLQYLIAFLLFASLSFAGNSCVKSNLDNAFDPAFPLGILIGVSVSGGGGGGSGECRYDQSSFDNCTFSE